MNLLIDIGNTRSKYTYVCQGNNFDVKTIANEQMNTDGFERHFIGASKVIVASVAAEQMTDTLALWCENQGITYQRIVSEKQKLQLTSAYEKPEQLGVDRWLALLGSINLYPQENILIIDAGTATTVDLLANNGVHQGGWILAGIDLLFHSIVNQTSKVEAQEVTTPSLMFGQNTNENVNNACWAASVGLINMAITQAEKQLNYLDRVIITGGNAKLLAKLLSTEVECITDLVFVGLQAYGE